MLRFESLANELLLEIFEYFDVFDLLRAFDGLNSRFNTLLYEHFRAYYLDLRRISTQDFDTLFRNRRVSIVDRIVSLRLGDRSETPGIFMFFMEFTFDQFINLRLLSICDAHCKDIITTLNQTHRLIYLIYLNISRCYDSEEKSMTPYLFNQIWNLPKLTYLNLEICNVSDAIFSQLKTVSSTLESLCIQNGIPHPLRDIADLYQKAPNLRVLSMNINLKNEYEKFPVVVTSIMTLKLDFCGELRALHRLFQNLPNLCHLTIDMQDHYLTGHEWKQIIIDHLPKLKQLRFKMFIAPLYDTMVEEEIDELLNTFRTQFWLDEHHWYVRCDWNPVAGSRTFGYLYTLPYVFRLFTSIAKGLRRSKWTCPDDEKYCLFNRVHNLDCIESVNEQLNIRHACFPNIHYLQISLPLPDNIWKITPTFDHLTSLRISIHEKDSESDLQVLFDRAPRLYKLIVDNADKSELTGLSKLKSASVRHLQFDSTLYSSPYYFDDEECTTFAMSSLGQQCEVLQLFVESRESVVNLVNIMTNLRTMSVHINYEENEMYWPAESELIKWIENHLPTKCSISYTDSYGDKIVLKMWNY